MSKRHVLAKLLQPIGPIRHQYQHSHLKIQMYIYIVRYYGTSNYSIPCMHVLLQPVSAVIYLPR